MTPLRLTYANTFTKQGFEAIIGGNFDSYYFPIYQTSSLRVEVNDDTISAYYITGRVPDRKLTSPEYNGEFDVHAYVNSLPEEELSNSMLHWKQVYKNGYSFDVFKKAVGEGKSCVYCFSYDEELTLTTDSVVVENIEIDYYANGSSVGQCLLTHSSGRETFPVESMRNASSVCDIVQPFTIDSKMNAFYRRKKIDDILTNI